MAVADTHLNRRQRIAQREAEAIVEQECEQYVRNKMRPQLTAQARHATGQFFRRDGIATPARRR